MSSCMGAAGTTVSKGCEADQISSGVALLQRIHQPPVLDPLKMFTWHRSQGDYYLCDT